MFCSSDSIPTPSGHCITVHMDRGGGEITMAKHLESGGLSLNHTAELNYRHSRENKATK